MKVALIVPAGVDRSGTHRVIPALLWLIERLAREHAVHVFTLYHEPRPSRYQLFGSTTGWKRCPTLAPCSLYGTFFGFA